jgi:hypothetical protein
VPISSLSGACAEVKGARRTSCALKPRTSTPVHALSDICKALWLQQTKHKLETTPDAWGQPIGTAWWQHNGQYQLANRCQQVHSRPGGDLQHPKACSASASDAVWLVRWTVRKDWLLTSAIGGDGDGRRVPLSVKNACFQGQRSAHAVQWCTDYYSGAVSGPALSPGSLGSAQAFQNPAGVLWCSAVTVTRGQSLLKKRDKTPRSQPWVGSKIMH